MVFVLLVLASVKPNQFNTDKFTNKFMVTVISKNSLEYYDFRMLRKQIRERREYIYRKHKEEAESKIRDRKDRLKRALDENKPIPTELRVRQSFKSSPGNEIRN